MASTASVIPIAGIDESNPYFVYDPAKCIVCSRCVRACDEVQGTFALTISGRGFSSIVSRRHERAVPGIGMRLLRRLRPGLPDRLADRKERARGAERRQARRPFGGDDLRLLRRRLLVQGRDARRRGRAHGAVEGRQGQSWPLLRQGPLRLGLRQPPRPHPQADAAREDQRPLARSVMGGGDRPRRRRNSRASGRRTASARSAASRRRAAPTRRRSWSRSWCAAVSATTTSTPAPASATRRPATDSPTPSARRPAPRISIRSTQSDVIVLMGANPTDAHPVFASRMKKRLRQGARLIVIDPRAIDLVRTPHVEAAYHLPLRPGTNVAMLAALAHVVVTEGLVNQAFVARALRAGRLRALGRVRRRPAGTAPRRSPTLPACRPRPSAPRRGSMPPAATARSITASASPSTARARPR